MKKELIKIKFGMEPEESEEREYDETEETDGVDRSKLEDIRDALLSGDTKKALRVVEECMSKYGETEPENEMESVKPMKSSPEEMENRMLLKALRKK